MEDAYKHTDTNTNCILFIYTYVALNEMDSTSKLACFSLIWNLDVAVVDNTLIISISHSFPTFPFVPSTFPFQLVTNYYYQLFENWYFRGNRKWETE